METETEVFDIHHPSFDYNLNSLEDFRGGPVSQVARRYAGFWVRCSALLFDQVLIVVPIIVLCRKVIASMGGTPAPSSYTVSLLICIVAWGGYTILLTARSGSTLGKRLVGIQVVAADQGPITLKTSTLRYVASLLSIVLPFSLGCIMAAFDDKKRALHDRLAETQVIQTGNSVGLRAFLLAAGTQAAIYICFYS